MKRAIVLGVVLVDTKYAGMGRAILDQVRSVTGKPVTTIINTHTHGDHTGGNVEFPRTVEFVTHRRLRGRPAASRTSTR
jgi:glyoxylase-like metal-dependent hydrolase (beta-lactamase superfamily II)